MVRRTDNLPKDDYTPEEASGCSENEARLPAGLYIVGTPIGNLKDITLRALDILSQCDLIASEDTRTTLKLLNRYNITTPLTSYHQHSGGQKSLDLLKQISAGKRIALVSEAGTPGISDPGHELIRGCIEKGIPVIPIPGPSAIITLLCAAGVNTSAFAYLGFPPRKPGERRKYFTDLSTETRTMVFYESPNRMRSTLQAMAEAFGDRKIYLGRELTKLHEEIWRGTLSDAVEEFTVRRPRGEFVIAVEGASPVTTGENELEKEYRRLVEEGMDDKAAISILARMSGWPRKEVYAAVLGWKGKR